MRVWPLGSLCTQGEPLTISDLCSWLSQSASLQVICSLHHPLSSQFAGMLIHRTKVVGMVVNGSETHIMLHVHRSVHASCTCTYIYLTTTYTPSWEQLSSASKQQVTASTKHVSSYCGPSAHQIHVARNKQQQACHQPKCFV